MGLEIERKFLLANDAWREDVAETQVFRQAYLCFGERMNLRVRLVGEESARLTIKGAHRGMSRMEFEYAIPPQDALSLLDLRTGAIVEKTRHKVPHGQHVWEIDVFAGENAGLVVAEIELGSETEAFERPPWLGREVTSDARYYNAKLAVTPYAAWDRG